MDPLTLTRTSWNFATAAHNSHKGDQAERLRAGWDPLFDEERLLLGDVAGKRVVHLQCNAGQDTLALARRGADLVGVDLSDHAIGAAQALSAASGIPARFVEAEVTAWMASTADRFDVAFVSYGATGWLPDLGAWARGVRRVLRPGGARVYVEFHPACWSYGADLGLTGDDYFTPGPYGEPVGDYVALSGDALGAVDGAPPIPNPIAAPSWQHTLADTVQALLDAGLRLEALHEWPHANGCRVSPGLVPLPGRRWGWPPGKPRLPLMFGLRAVRPTE